MHPSRTDSALSSVCFFSHSAMLSGGERSLLELATELVTDYGLRCDVVLPSDGPLVALLAAVGAITHIVPFSAWFTFSPVPAHEIRTRLSASLESTLLATCNELAAIRPDVVCTNTIVLPWGAMAARLLGKPHVWYVRELGRPEHGLVFAPPLEDIVRMVGESSEQIIVASDAVRRELFGGTYHDKCRVVHNHVPTPRVAATISRRLFKIAGAFHLLLLGPFCPGKAQKEAVLAVDELRRSGIQVELILAGLTTFPAYRTEVASLIEDCGLSAHVQLLDFLQDPYPAIAETDALLSCSRHEAFGRTLVEAMLLGKPVVAARSGGIPEIVTDRQTGLLYEVGDHVGLAKAITYLINDPARTSQLASQGRSWAAEHLTKERYGGRVYEIFQETVDAWRRQPHTFDDFWKPQALQLVQAWHQRWQGQVSELQATVSAQAATLQERLATIRQREDCLAQRTQELAAQVEQVNRLRAAIAASDQALAVTQIATASAAPGATRLAPESAAAQSPGGRWHYKLQLLQGSRAWKIADRLLPRGSYRREMVKSAARLTISGLRRLRNLAHPN